MAKPKAATKTPPKHMPKARRDALWAAIDVLPLVLRDGQDRHRLIAWAVAEINFSHLAAWASEPYPAQQADAGERLQIIAKAARDLRRAFPGRDVTAWEALQALEPARLDAWVEPSGKKDPLALLAEAAAVVERFSDKFMSPTFRIKPGDETAARKRLDLMRRKKVPSAAGYLALAIKALDRVDLDKLEAAAAELKATARKRGRKEVKDRNVRFAMRLAEIYAYATGKKPTLGIRGGRPDGGPFPVFAKAIFEAYGRPWQLEAAKSAVELWRQKHVKS